LLSFSNKALNKTFETESTLSDRNFQTSLRSIVNDAAVSPRRRELIGSFLNPLHTNPLNLPKISFRAAQSAAQDILDSDFRNINSNLTNDYNSMDTSRLAKFTAAGDYDLSWIDKDLLALSFADGVASGRLAAIAYFGLIETGELVNGITKKEKVSSKIDDISFSLSQINTLAKAYSSPDFLNFGLNAARFRPAVRVQSTCLLFAFDGGPQKIVLQTPFCPREPGRSPTAAESAEFQLFSEKVVGAIQEQFSDPVAAMQTPPLSTATLHDAAIPGCGENFRNANMLLSRVSSQHPELQSATLQDVVIVPEITSAWTFAGMGTLRSAQRTSCKMCRELASLHLRPEKPSSTSIKEL
jgi:hypothetical protein